MAQPQYRLPDLLRNWPWKRHISTHYEHAKKDSSAWIGSFRPFDRDGQRAFDACDLNLLASLTYSRRDKEFIRIGCDLMNFYFVYDEYTDVSNASVAHRLADIVVSAMKNPEDKPKGEEHILGRMTRQFWERARSLAPADSSCFEHFIRTSETYLRAVTQEAEDRASKRVRTIDDYLPLRRDSCGARPTLALIEFGLGLPDEVLAHPILVSLTQAAVDLIILVNDMHSYIREISCGLANHNILTPIMHEHNLDLQAALDWLGIYSDNVVAQFLTDMDRVPSWGEVTDAKVREYIDGLGQWVRGNEDWSCEGKRYHGNDGLQVRATRLVSLRPRKSNYISADKVGISSSTVQTRMATSRTNTSSRVKALRLAITSRAVALGL